MRSWLLLTLLGLIQIALLDYRGAVCSCVCYEESRLASGLVQIYTGDFSTFRVNPPLPGMAAALPLACMDVGPADSYSKPGERLIRQRHEYVAGRRFVEEHGEASMRYLRIARLSCVVFALAGTLLCYSWARRCYGTYAGLLAAVLWAASPFVLGHGCLVGTDIPAAAMGLVALYCFWRWLKTPQWPEAMIAGIGLGLAELCKFTLLVMCPLLPLLWLVYRLTDLQIMGRHDWLRQAAMLSLALLLSIYVVNCGYVFEDTFTPLERFRFQSMLLTGHRSLEDIPAEGANRFADTWIGKLPVPFPANMVQGIDTQRFDFERGLRSYLRERWADHGWWYYYGYALAIKVPLGTWCLLAMAIGVTLLGRGYSATWRDEMVVLAPGLAILIFVSSQTGFSIHSRYVVPALPFFFVWASKVGRVFEMQPCTRKRQVLAVVVVMALAWSVTSSLWVYPHSLSYFNELVGGPKRGGEHLVDSNIDWGQDLFYLKHWLHEHPEVKLDGLACFGSYPVTLAGIPETPSPPQGPETIHARMNAAGGDIGPQPGWYALSVNYLYGRTPQYRYFLQFEPAGSAGYSIYIYHVTPEAPNRVRRESGMPEIPQSK